MACLHRLFRFATSTDFRIYTSFLTEDKFSDPSSLQKDSIHFYSYPILQQLKVLAYNTHTKGFVITRLWYPN